MDPQSALDAAERALDLFETTHERGLKAEARQHLRDYSDWRRRRGYEPPGGDARAEALTRRMKARARKATPATGPNRTIARQKLRAAIKKTVESVRKADAAVRKAAGRAAAAELALVECKQRLARAEEKAAAADDKLRFLDAGAMPAGRPHERPQSENEEARQWLIHNDPDGTSYWRSLPAGEDFIGAKEDNLRDFGEED